MTISRSGTGGDAELLVRPELDDGKQFSAVTLWSVMGGLILAFEVYVIGKWLLGPNFKSVDPGPTPVPTYMKISMTGLTIVGAVLFVAVVWFYMIKPWRREGHITLDGLLVIVFTALCFVDPLPNLWGMFYSNNAWMWNRGSWACEVPGAMQHNSCGMPEPLLITPAAYLWMVFGGVILANALMRYWKRKKPNLGPVGLVFRTFAFMVLLDLTLEIIFIGLGYYTFFFGVEGVTWQYGSYMRFPVHESIMWSATWTALAALRYFTNDRGQTVVERGTEYLTGGAAKVTLIRFLALLGVVHTMMAIIYILPANILTHYGPGPNVDQMKRSYFMNNLCGDGTEYACPGPGVPVFGPKTLHVDPEGNLIPGRAPMPPRVKLHGSTGSG